MLGSQSRTFVPFPSSTRGVNCQEFQMRLPCSGLSADYTRSAVTLAHPRKKAVSARPADPGRVTVIVTKPVPFCPVRVQPNLTNGRQDRFVRHLSSSDRATGLGSNGCLKNSSQKLKSHS